MSDNPQHSSKNDRWLTPSWITDVANEVLGHIDLDPASEEEANRSVKAKRFINETEDGLLADWGEWSKVRNLFLNPPGGRLDKVKYPQYKQYNSLPQAFSRKLQSTCGVVIPAL